MNSNFVSYQRKTGIVKFRKIYGLKLVYRYLIVAALGVIFGFAIAFLQKNTGIYSVGVAGITQGFARLAQTLMSLNNIDQATISLVFNLIFWGLYLVLNIPLLIFAYLKINKHLALMSILYLTCVNVVGFILGFFPELDNVFIFGTTDPANAQLIAHNVQVLDWMNNQDLARVVSLLFYIIAYAPITGLTLSLLYICGGSAGGADPISIYYSIVKQKSLGNIIIIVNMSGLLIANLIGSYIPAGVVDGNFGFSRFLSPNMLVSLIYVLVTGVLINRWYPKNKPIKVGVYTNKVEPIVNTLKDQHFNYVVLENVDSRKEVDSKIEIVCTYGQFLSLYQKIRNCDSDAFIFTDIIHDLDGRIDLENRTNLKVKTTNKK